MKNTARATPFPLFRFVLVGCLMVVSRFLKYVIPFFSFGLIILWLGPLLANLLHDSPIKTEFGDILTLSELLYMLGKLAIIGTVSLVVGELLIRLNERFAFSIEDEARAALD